MWHHNITINTRLLRKLVCVMNYEWYVLLYLPFTQHKRIRGTQSKTYITFFYFQYLLYLSNFPGTTSVVASTNLFIYAKRSSGLTYVVKCQYTYSPGYSKAIIKERKLTLSLIQSLPHQAAVTQLLTKQNSSCSTLQFHYLSLKCGWHSHKYCSTITFIVFPSSNFCPHEFSSQMCTFLVQTNLSGLHLTT